MAKYIVLVNWTDKGIQAAKETEQRAEQVRVLAEQMGGHMDLLYWTLGRYDLVGVWDMPNDEAMAALALKVAGGGAVRTECLRAFTAEDMSGIIASLG